MGVKARPPTLDSCDGRVIIVVVLASPRRRLAVASPRLASPRLASTRLDSPRLGAQVCYYLKAHGVNCLISACDTFRSGAVEQLRQHARVLDVPLFEKGYLKVARSLLVARSLSLSLSLADGYDGGGGPQGRPLPPFLVAVSDAVGCSVARVPSVAVG